jgi:hypothetical protein
MGSTIASVAGMAVGSHGYKSSIFAPAVSVAGPPAPTPPVDFLLQEDGFFLLQENGDKLILE